MKQSHFMLFPWGMIARKGERADKFLESIKECGFNGSCFVSEDEFDTCRRLGLEIYCALDSNPCEERSLPHEIALFDKNMDTNELANIMNEKLRNLPRDVKHIYVTDEPGAGLFSRIKVLVDCVHKKTPWAEAYINLFPNYAVCGAPDLSQLQVECYEEYLERFAKEVNPDALGLDNYQVIASDNFKKESGRISYFRNLLQARSVCDKYNIPFQFVACCNQLRYNYTIPTYANLAFQGYTSLAAGARTLSWFLLYGRNDYLYTPIDDRDNDRRTNTWYQLRDINRQILPLGELLFDMEYKGMYFSKEQNFKEAQTIDICSDIRNFSSDQQCVLGHYVDKVQDDIWLVVNIDLHNSANVEIDLGNQLMYYNTQSESWQELMLTSRKGESPIWLEAGCGILIKAKK